MWYALLPVIGFIVGLFLTFLLMYPTIQSAKRDLARFRRLRSELDLEWDRLETKQEQVQKANRRIESRIEEYNSAVDALRKAESAHERQVVEWNRQQQAASTAAVREREEWENKLQIQQDDLAAQRGKHDARVIAYESLAHENRLLKSEIKNLSIHTAFLEHLRETSRAGQTTAAEQRDELGRAYFEEVVSAVRKVITASNLPQNRQRVQAAAERVRAAGVDLTPKEEQEALSLLRAQYEKAVSTLEKREKEAQDREEEKRKREIAEAEEAAKQAEAERAAVEAELARARAEAARQAAEAMGRENEEIAARHAETIQALLSKLAEAEARSQRAISNAQLTKKGCVYVISNIGSFGESVFKIGMSRRSDPKDRIDELSGASVPFPFDVHMQIQCDDAPALENALHREFHHCRLNRVNLRKEFFRVPINEIVAAVERHHGTVEYVIDAEASQYRNSLMATDADLEEIDDTFDVDDETNRDETDG